MSNELILNPDIPDEREIMITERRFASALKMAENLCKSGDLIPKIFRNNPSATMIALNMARRMNVEPLHVMQSINIIHGKPSFSSKFLIAQINGSNTIDGSLTFEYEEGEQNAVVEYTFFVNNQPKTGTETINDSRCRAVGLRNGEPIFGAWVSVAMAVREGWYSKPGSKWKTMAELMLQYRAASFWAGVYAPELTLGVATVDEIVDSSATEKLVNPDGAQALLDDLDPLNMAQGDLENEFSPVVGKEQPETIIPPSVDLTRPIWVGDENGGHYTDHSTPPVVYDENLHAFNKTIKCPSMTADGLFRKKRGLKQEEKPETEPRQEREPAQEPPQNDVETIEQSVIDSACDENPFLRAILTHIDQAETDERLTELAAHKVNMLDSENKIVDYKISERRAILNPIE